MKRMICDRCGLEILDKDDQYLALEGQQAWEKAARARGGEARGIMPCKNYIRCGGEIVLVDDKKTTRRNSRLKKVLSQPVKLLRKRQS